MRINATTTLQEKSPIAFSLYSKGSSFVVVVVARNRTARAVNFLRRGPLTAGRIVFFGENLSICSVFKKNSLYSMPPFVYFSL